MDKQEELEKLKSEMEADKSLPKYPGATQLVFGDGNPDSEFYFLGEAPGYYEDQQGRPFVGQAGQLLNRSLEKIGLKREDVYISNVVRYRPPNNRDPLPSEISAFQEYVTREIEIIKPKIIVTLGRFSMGKFFPGEYISRIHGKPRKMTWRDLNVTIIPMYHPAAALRNGAVMRQFEADFLVVKKIMEELKNERTDKPASQGEQNNIEQLNLV